MTPRMKDLIARFKAADPAYKGPSREKAKNSPYARWINGMSEETYQAYMQENVEFMERMRMRKEVQRRIFYRDLGKTKDVDLRAEFQKRSTPTK